MAALDPSIAESTLLCEDCGYVLDRMAEGAVCPECGKPVAESLPSRRTGSPFQARPGIGTWLRTLVRTIRHPVSVWDTVVIGGGTADQLLFSTLIAAAIGVILPPAVLLSLLSPGSALLLVVVGPFVAIAVTLVLYWLTRIEEWGIRYFGSRRGWRITPAVARSITAHAAVGWLTAALLFWPLMILNFMYEPSRIVQPGAGAVWPVVLAVLQSSLPFLGAFIGLLVFEVLVYIGVRRCRFANHESAHGHADTTPRSPSRRA